MTVKFLYKCGYLYRDDCGRYARTDKDFVCAQEQPLKKMTSRGTSPAKTVTNTVEDPKTDPTTVGTTSMSNDSSNDWIEFEPEPASRNPAARLPFLNLPNNRINNSGWDYPLH